MADQLRPGLYEQLFTVELQWTLAKIEAGRADVVSPEPADAHVAVAEHLRRILERALHAVPEDERLTRQAEICNALVTLLIDKQRSTSVEPDDALVIPLTVLREVRALARGTALSGTSRQPLVPLSSADLVVNARGEPSVGAAIEREIHSADRIDLLCACSCATVNTRAGRTAAYTCLGAADFVSHRGNKSIAMTWRLRRPMPDDFFREAKVAAG